MAPTNNGARVWDSQGRGSGYTGGKWPHHRSGGMRWRPYWKWPDTAQVMDIEIYYCINICMYVCNYVSMCVYLHERYTWRVCNKHKLIYHDFNLATPHKLNKWLVLKRYDWQVLKGTSSQEHDVWCGRIKIEDTALWPLSFLPPSPLLYFPFYLLARLPPDPCSPFLQSSKSCLLTVCIVLSYLPRLKCFWTEIVPTTVVYIYIWPTFIS